MAEETAETAAIPAEGAAGGEAGAAPPKKGIKAFLIPVLAALLAGGAAVATVKLKDKFSGKGAAEPPSAEGEHGEAKPHAEVKPAAAPAGDHGATKASAAPAGEHGAAKGGAATTGRNKDLPVPLTSSLITFRYADATKDGDADKILTLDVKGDPQDLATPQAIVRNIANTSGSRFVVVKILLVSAQEDFLKKLNLKNQHLIAAAGETLGRMTMKDLEQAGIQTLLRRYFLSEFNNILGPGSLQDVLLTGFAIQ